MPSTRRSPAVTCLSWSTLVGSWPVRVWVGHSAVQTVVLGSWVPCAKQGSQCSHRPGVSPWAPELRRLLLAADPEADLVVAAAVPLEPAAANRLDLKRAGLGVASSSWSHHPMLLLAKKAGSMLALAASVVPEVAARAETPSKAAGRDHLG